MTGYQGRSIGTWSSSGHQAIPARQECSLVGPGPATTYLVQRSSWCYGLASSVASSPWLLLT